MRHFRFKLTSLVAGLLVWELIWPPALAVALAEEATPSASLEEATPSASLEPAPIASQSSELAATPAASLDEFDLDLLPLFAPPDEGNSARVKRKAQVRPLKKQNYRADEKVTLVVDNESVAQVGLALFDSDGLEVDLQTEVVSETSPTVVQLLPPRQFRPGRYNLKVEPGEEAAITQDFTWGVLAVNTNKSIYLPNETAKFALAVLDETGMMVCDAKVNLHLVNQEAGLDETLSTETGQIRVNPECQLKELTTRADYEAEYLLSGAGVYQMTLTAETKEGSYSISDSFEVREDVVFDVERQSTTRVFPPVTYPMRFKIKANQDFRGTISEVVPASLAVNPAERGVSYNQIDQVTGSEASEAESAMGQLSAPFDWDHPISLGFGQQLRDPVQGKKYADFGLLGHDGVDFDMPEGTAVLAVDDGVVVKTDTDGDYGTTVVIQHAWGKSYYGHLSRITAQLGAEIERGHPLGLSGSTGLSTGPHLHFGIKANSNDMDNGYYGKINPLPYLALKEGNQEVLAQAGQVKQVLGATNSQPESDWQVISWEVDLKQGQGVELEYRYQTPNISPQFYVLGPLKFTDSSGAVVWQEARRWQLAVDANGSGTNTVSPATGATSAQDQTYTFTFTAGETMDSGEIKITAPVGWNAPQGASGTAGYTTVTGNSNATVATVFDAFNSATGWAEVGGTDACQTGPVADTTDKQEGTGSITCNDDTSGANGPDSGDGIVYSFTSQDWSAYTDFGFWMRDQNGSVAANFQYNINDGTDCTTTPIQTVTSSALTANQWTFEKFTLLGTRTAVTRFCVRANTAAALDNNQIWVDEALLGPGTPTFSGQDVSFRVLDAANAETFSIVYGSGGGTSGVDNPATAQVYTFTTQSRPVVTGALANLTAGSPTIELCASGCGPTNDQLLRHGGWFSGGVEKPFTF